MAIAKSEQTQKRDARLRLTMVPATNGLGFIEIYSSDKREVAKQLVERFTKNPAGAENYDFRKLDLSNTDLSGLNLRALGARALRQIDFSGSNLSGQDFSNLNLRGANFKGAHMEGVHFEGSNLENANFQGAYLARSNFQGAVATGANFNKVVAPGACFDGAFKGAQFNGADLRGCYMGNANFENASMKGVNLAGIINTGDMNFKNAKMQGANLAGDFANANFAGADLSNANMEHGDFTGANFAKTNIFNIKTAFAKLDDKAFNDAFDPTPMDTKLDIAIPKPSFGSKAVLLKAMIQKMGPEAPTMESFKTAKFRHFLQNIPKPEPPGG